jgi:hypothetical protein
VCGCCAQGIDGERYITCGEILDLTTYLHMSVKHIMHVDILILYKATCFDFQQVIIKNFSERKNIKVLV